ncbi:MAG: RNA-binding S4 domain-containing protein [Deltaproteobacteria bacterium]|nr:RNA-binding S4 domain-containing protein [Deltaproteobacteria bacterium]
MSFLAKSAEPVRLDKWLWAARFFKTRSLAAEAVEGGKVQLNGARSKPAHVVRSGDELKIRREAYEWTVIVRAVSKHRRPFSEAQLLYDETEESKNNRERVAEQLRFEGIEEPDMKGRPTKKARRDRLRFTRRV